MHELQIFNYQRNEVRMMLQDGVPWWVLKDVCNVLGLSDTNKVSERLDADELTRIKFVSGGQTREMYVVNEPGLYSVILRSDKPEAKAFKHWITHEVLPAIRKTGQYKQPAPRKPRSKPEDVIFRQQMNIAKAFSSMTGIPLGIAAATALNIIEERTGLDYSHWKKALPARAETTQIPRLNATNLGALLHLSAQDANKLLESAGFQIHEGKSWRLTEAGKAHGEEYPFQRNGHSDYRILWRDSAADALGEVHSHA
jgi:prophage antirepressor-like protein